jgi:signal transduction histidine kinase
VVRDGHLHWLWASLRSAAAGSAETPVSVDYPGGRDDGLANRDFSTESDTSGIRAAPACRERPRRTKQGATVTARLWHLAAWPLVVKVPVLVAGLMVTVAATTSQVVLWRFAQDQETNLRLLTGAYLDGLSSAVLPALARRDARGVFDVLDRAQADQYAGFKPRFAIFELPNGTVLASSDPRHFPVQSAVPDELHRRFTADDGLAIDADSGRAWIARTLRTEGLLLGRLFAEVDIADSVRVRRDILLTLVLVNGCLTLAFALGGYFVLKRMLQPLGALTRYVEQIREGRVEPIPIGYCHRVASEFGQLFDRFNAMALAFSERQTLAAHLAQQEKCAMLGRLASGMAHEVNNPLAGMLNAIDTIQAHGRDPAVLQASLEFLKRGLAGIRNVVHATLVTYKGSSDAGLLTRPDLDDLRFLVQHETGARRLGLDWDNRITEPLAIDGPAVRQITLNLLLNACAASPDGGRVAVTVSGSDRELQIVVADRGPGLPENMAALLHHDGSAPTPWPESKGLGLWTTGDLVRRLGGRIDIEYPGVGTRVVVNLPVGMGEALRVAA